MLLALAQYPLALLFSSFLKPLSYNLIYRVPNYAFLLFVSAFIKDYFQSWQLYNQAEKYIELSIVASQSVITTIEHVQNHLLSQSLNIAVVLMNKIKIKILLKMPILYVFKCT